MEKELGGLFLTSPVPNELEAQRRAWNVVRTAYAEREPVSRRRSLRPILALAVLVALVAAALSPPGRAVGDWIRDSVRGEQPAQPALFRLPTGGQLLVASERGPWVVRRDGSKRLLGRYEGAGFSPTGSFLVVTRGRRVVAVEPDGDPRWTVTRPQPVADARWAPGKFRIAYRAGRSLRVVDGNGTDDGRLARRVAPVAPAWRPDTGVNVLAYADPAGRVHVVDADSRREVWRSRAGPPVRELVWSADGRLLLVVTKSGRHPVLAGRGRVARTIELPKGHLLVEASFAPRGESLAYTDFDPARERGAVILDDRRGSRTLQSGEGRLEDVVWSPDGRWLLVGWPDADQWLFLRLPGVRKIKAVEDIRREFDPGGEGGGSFPRVAGWCCPRQR
jgi:dipeptidyl aminopeptidase/acylaminoacyl peptidase